MQQMLFLLFCMFYFWLATWLVHSKLQLSFLTLDLQSSFHTILVSCCCRADTAERNLAAAQDSLADSRQSLDTLQTHHSSVKQHLERAELHSQDSATQAREFAARVKELSADKEALVSELVTVNKSAAHMKQDFKCLVKCLKGSEPLQAITALLEEAESDSGAKARSSELMWVMKRLCDHFKQSSGTVYQHSGRAQIRLSSCTSDVIRNSNFAVCIDCSMRLYTWCEDFGVHL